MMPRSVSAMGTEDSSGMDVGVCGAGEGNELTGQDANWAFEPGEDNCDWGPKSSSHLG